MRQSHFCSNHIWTYEGLEIFVDMKFSRLTSDRENIIFENDNYYSTVTNLFCIGHACTASVEIKYTNTV